MISIVLLATIGNAQETVSDKSLKETLDKRTKLVAELEKVGENEPILSRKVTKNKPYSAETVSESIQVLVDGNRITRSTTVKMFRDSEGRTRREGNGIAGNFSGSDISGFAPAFSLGFSNTISIYDPVNAVRYNLNPKTKTARRYDNQNPFGVAKIIINNSTLPRTLRTKKLSEMSAEERAEVEKKFAELGKNFTKLDKNFAELDKNFTKLDKDFSNIVILGSVAALSYKSTKSESLGTKTIEGVEAEGTRTVKTIEAGAVGNDKPIEVVYEKWYSKDLELIIYSRNYDPRYGEQIYRLVNIDQTEPDNSLFTVPSDYKIVDEKQ